MTEPIKVYELAKELGIAPLELVDRLKGMNIQVKNHMSDLATSEVELARTSLKKAAEPEKPAKGAVKRTATTRSAASKTTAAKPAAGATAAAAATPARTRKKATDTAAAPAAAPEAQ